MKAQLIVHAVVASSDTNREVPEKTREKVSKRPWASSNERRIVRASQGVVAAETLIGLFFLDLMDPEWRGIFPLLI